MNSSDSFTLLLCDRRYSTMVDVVASQFFNMAQNGTNYRCLEDFRCAALLGLWKAFRNKREEFGDAFFGFALRKMKWECADYLETLVKRQQKTRQLELFDEACMDKGDSEDGSGSINHLLDSFYVREIPVRELARREGMSLNMLKAKLDEARESFVETAKWKLERIS